MPFSGIIPQLIRKRVHNIGQKLQLCIFHEYTEYKKWSGLLSHNWDFTESCLPLFPSCIHWTSTIDNTTTVLSRHVGIDLVPTKTRRDWHVSTPKLLLDVYDWVKMWGLPRCIFTGASETNFMTSGFFHALKQTFSMKNSSHVQFMILINSWHKTTIIVERH